MSGSKVDVKVVLLGMHDVGKTCAPLPFPSRDGPCAQRLTSCPGLVERYLHGKFKFNVTAVRLPY